MRRAQRREGVLVYLRLYTKSENVTARWPSGVKEGAEFSMPTM